MKKTLILGFLFLMVIFLMGFWDVGPYVLMALLLPLLFWSIYILWKSRRICGSAYFKVLVTITGLMGILFTFGVCYGIFGMKGLYRLDNTIYLGTVISSFLGLILGILLSLIDLWMRVIPKE